jgi:hypothetical protein
LFTKSRTPGRLFVYFDILRSYTENKSPLIVITLFVEKYIGDLTPILAPVTIPFIVRLCDITVSGVFKVINLFLTMNRGERGSDHLGPVNQEELEWGGGLGDVVGEA